MSCDGTSRTACAQNGGSSDRQRNGVARMLSVKTTTYRDGGSGRSKAQKRLLLWRRQRGLCAICSLPVPLRSSTIDHFIPRSKGGPNVYANLRVTHGKCNQTRGASMDDVFVVAGGIKALRWNVKELP